jgi:hypothetical protein
MFRSQGILSNRFQNFCSGFTTHLGGDVTGIEQRPHLIMNDPREGIGLGDDHSFHRSQSPAIESTEPSAAEM